jgi:hypothetical protein
VHTDVHVAKQKLGRQKHENKGIKNIRQRPNNQYQGKGVSLLIPPQLTLTFFFG